MKVGTVTGVIIKKRTDTTSIRFPTVQADYQTQVWRALIGNIPVQHLTSERPDDISVVHIPGRVHPGANKSA